MSGVAEVCFSFTLTVHDAMEESDAAVISVSPAATAVPSPSTVATVSILETQETDLPSVVAAVSFTVAPTSRLISACEIYTADCG